MIIQLVRHTFPDRPDWEIIGRHVPLGTKYEVLGYESRASIMNLITGETRNISLYLVGGNEDIGWLPTICFEVDIKES
jgi:hypothetical protein